MKRRLKTPKIVKRPPPAKLTDSEREKARTQYRKAKGSKFELDGSVVKNALEFYQEHGIVLPVFNEITGKTEKRTVFRVTKMAQLLNVSYQTFWRWVTETQQMPIPVLMDSTTGRDFPVYHEAEARVMLQVLGGHFTEYKYYRKDHSATKTRLFAEIEKARAEHLTSGEDSNGNSQRKGTGTGRKSKSKGTRSRSRSR